MGSKGNRRFGGKFMTDTDISRASGPVERRLEAWVDTSGSGSAENLESGSDKPWDQFAANRKKFGIVPTFDERMYTTEVDRSHPDFEARARRAERLAREIEGGKSGRFDDVGSGDEEDLFSGVQRTENTSASEFAAEESQNAMADPNYVENKEAEERKADEASTTAGDSAGDPSDMKSKKKFNFAASAAKMPSFKRAGFTPSPAPSFSPMQSASPSPVSFGIPGPIPGPMAPPPAFVPPPGMSVPVLGPPLGDVPLRDTKPIDVSKLRNITAKDFNFVAHVKEAGEKLPKVYFTPPTWAAPGQASEFYADQFPQASPRMMMMPPVMMVPRYA